MGTTQPIGTADVLEEALERRTLFDHGGKLAVREAGKDMPPGSVGVIEGYAVVYDQWSEDLWGGHRGQFRERIRPGAFAKSLADGADVRALWSHDSAAVMGRMTAGTLAVRDDGKGLFATLYVPDTQLGRDAMTLVKRGDVRGWSPAFYVSRDKWTKEKGKDGDREQRDVEEAQLLELSLVAFPAYPQTSAQTRARQQDDQRKRAERLARTKRAVDEYRALCERVFARTSAPEPRG